MWRPLLIVALLVSSCSFVSIGIRFADWLIMYRINAALDLSDEQEAVVEEQVEDLLVWARIEVVPELKAIIDRTVDYIGSDAPDPRAIDSLEMQVASLRQRVLEHIAPHIAELNTTLSSEQIAHFSEYLDERLARRVEISVLGDEDFEAEVLERRFDIVEKWFGDVSAAQQQEIRDLWPVRREEYHAGIARRRRANEKIIAAVRLRMTNEKWLALVRSWCERPAGLVDGGDDAKYLARRALRRERVHSVVKMLTKEQRAYFIERAAQFRKDLDLL